MGLDSLEVPNMNRIFLNPYHINGSKKRRSDKIGKTCSTRVFFLAGQNGSIRKIQGECRGNTREVQRKNWVNTG